MGGEGIYSAGCSSYIGTCRQEGRKEGSGGIIVLAKEWRARTYMLPVLEEKPGERAA